MSVRSRLRPASMLTRQRRSDQESFRSLTPSIELIVITLIARSLKAKRIELAQSANQGLPPNLLSRTLGCRIGMGLLLVAALFAAPASFAGCDVKTSNVATNQFLVIGACANDSDAQQECIGFAEGHGYDAGYCHLGGETVAGTNWSFWGAGNLCETNPGPSANNCGSNPATGAANPTYLGDFFLLQYYSSAHPDIRKNCSTCNRVDDPIDPANGAVYTAEFDAKEQNDGLAFKRFYNSSDANTGDLSVGWRHNFSRSIQPRYSSISYQPYVQGDANNSPAYSTPASACTFGFAQIQAHIANWNNATASYSNGTCSLMQGGVIIGTLPLFAFQPQLPSSELPSVINAILGPMLVGVDATRDDGQLISFTLNGGSIVAPPSINLKLQQTSSGYTLTDANDTVETYNTNGKLLTVASRAGVVQTLSYDASDRLSGVSDTFGHQLTLGYDAQNRLIAVTRQ
jgi:YD repeat-containing protein